MAIKFSDESKSISDIKGLLCIDLWEDDNLEEFYKTLETNVNYDQFDSIVVANYEMALDSKDLSQYNTVEVYSWETFTPSVLLPIMKETRFRQASKYIKKHFKSHSFILLDTDSFQHHVTTFVPHIKDWFVMGGGWQSCLHSRPVGLRNLLDVPYNFYITPWSVYTQSQQSCSITELKTDKLNWIDQSNNLYRLDNGTR
jgi:hypothetical protein